MVPSNIFNALTMGDSSAVPGSNATPSPAPQQNALDIQISLSAAGLQLAMTAQGNIVSSMMINAGFPIVRLNTFLKSAVMPIIAAYGPWSSGFGLRDARVEFRVAITEEEGTLTITEATKTVTLHNSTNVIIEQMPMETVLSLTKPNDVDSVVAHSVSTPLLEIAPPSMISTTLNRLLGSKAPLRFPCCNCLTPMILLLLMACLPKCLL